jgi:hypothetical protein
MSNLDNYENRRKIKLLKYLAKEHERLQNENIEKNSIELFVKKTSENIENKNKIIESIKEIISSLSLNIEEHKQVTKEGSKKLVEINARGTIIKVPREAIKRSKIIKEWFDKTDKEFYMSRNPIDVHSLIDYLEERDYNNPIIIDEMIEEYEIELDDTKKMEYKYIEKIYEEIKDKKNVTDNLISYNTGINEPNKIKILAKKLLKYNETICDTYIIKKNMIHLLIKEKEKMNIEQQDKILEKIKCLRGVGMSGKKKFRKMKI